MVPIMQETIQNNKAANVNNLIIIIYFLAFVG